MQAPYLGKVCLYSVGSRGKFSRSALAHGTNSQKPDTYVLGSSDPTGHPRIADSETRDTADPEYPSRLGCAGVEKLRGARISGRAQRASQRAHITSGQVAVGSQLEEQMETTATEASLGENDQKHTMFGLPSASASDKLVPATSAKQHKPPGQPSSCCTCVCAWVQHIAARRKHADSKHDRERTHGARTCTRRTHTPPRHPSLLTHATMHSDPSYLPSCSLLFLLLHRDCASGRRAFARCVAAIRAYQACVTRHTRVNHGAADNR